jgi:ERCC4-type nuclease
MSSPNSSESLNTNVILDKQTYTNDLEFINHLNEEHCKVNFDSLGSNLIVIPPNVGIYYIRIKSITRKEHIQDLTERMEAFCSKYSNRIVILEGFGDNFSETDLGILMTGLMMRIVLKVPQGFIPTRNITDTVLCLRSISRREQIADIPPILSRKKPKSASIGEQRQILIEGLRLIGPKKATELLKNFPDPHSIFQAIMHDPEKILAIKGFGPRFIEENQKLLTMDLSSQK